MKLSKSKRLNITIACIGLNFAIGVLGVIYSADLTALGTFLALANTPLYAYILGESFRPSSLRDDS